MTFRPELARGVAATGARSRFGIERSRLSVYAALGASAAAVPIPWIPDTLVSRVRGAVVHDVATQHGVALTTEARRALSQRRPGAILTPAGVAAQTIRFVGLRIAGRTLSRFAPVGMLWPVRDAIRTYALGHLFDHYLRTIRPEVGGTMDAPEARIVRAAIDGAAAHILSVDTTVVDPPEPGGDARDSVTALIDRVLTVTASLPERLVRRLEAAFDEALTRP